MRITDRPMPLRRFRRPDTKPPLPAHLEPLAESARKRHAKRHANPGVAIEVEKVTERAYRLASPHSDIEAWQAMVCDALGTRSEATALTFLYQLTKLCQQDWHPDEENGGGEWVPDECELNMILNMVSGIRPKNEMQAALAAQMVAVHMMMMKVTERCLTTYQCADSRMVAVAGKLARTFAIQTEALSKLQGRRTTRQKITVSYEKHEHQHVHMHRGGEENDSQAHAAMESRISSHGRGAALPCSDQEAIAVPVSGSKRKAGLPNARRG